MQRIGFLVIYFDVYVIFYVIMSFHLVALNFTLKLRFRISSHASHSQQKVFKRDFIKTSCVY